MPYPAPSPPALRLVSFNAHGLRSRSKFQALIHWARTSPYHIIVVQETWVAGDPFTLEAQGGEAGVSSHWPGSYFWCPGTGRAAGVLVLVKGRGPATEAVQHGVGDPSGRLLRVDFQLGTHVCSLIAVYAPAQPSERAAFYRERLSPMLQGCGTREIIMGGDFNCVASPLDRTDALPSAASSRHVGSNELADCLAAAGLVDVWRHQHRHAVTATHWSGRSNSGARLDRWYLPAAMLADAYPASGVEAGDVPVTSDHTPVSLSLSIPAAVPRAPRRLHFPTHQLGQPQFTASVSSWIAGEVLAVTMAPAGSKVQAWVHFKRRLAAHAHLLAAQARAAANAALNAAEDRAVKAHAALVASRGGAAERAEAAEAVAAVVAIHRERAVQATRASGVLQQLYGDTSTFYFHSFGKAPRSPATIHALKAAGAAVDSPAVSLSSMHGTAAALSLAVDHFSSLSPTGLFRQRPSCPQARLALLQALPRRLTAEMASKCEGANGDGTLSLGDLSAALAAAGRGRAPGEDGLPYEVYMAFWPQLGQALVHVANDAFEGSTDPQPLAAMLHGLICLVPKPNKPRDSMSGYRPLTLLNADVKLIARAVADRLHAPLDYVVDLMQAAFIQGRDIGDNILYHLALAEYLADIQHPAWLLLTDLASAYDSVSREYLLDALAALGFKASGHVRWAHVLHAGTSASVIINGWHSMPFPVLGSLAQGSGVSPLYWTVVMQPLAAYLTSLHSSGRITTPALPDGSPAPVESSFADDMPVLLEDADTQGPVVVSAFHMFEQASGVALSVEKTLLVPLGPHQPGVQHDSEERVHAATGFRIPPASQPPKLLGIPFTPNFHLAQHMAFHVRMTSGISMRASAWKGLNLNLVGRAHVAKQCLASTYVHAATFLPPPKEDLQAASAGLRAFVANTPRLDELSPGKAMHPGGIKAALPWRDGGINLVHPESQVAALLAKAIARATHPRYHPWKVIMRHQLAAAAKAEGCSNSWAWAVTLPTRSASVLSRPQHPCPRLHAHVSSFAQVRPFRLKPAADLSFLEVMAEPLFANPAITRLAGGRRQPLRLSDVGSVAAQETWTHVRHLRAALRSHALLPADQQADLAALLPLLPAEWREAVQQEGPDPPTGWLLLRAAARDGLDLVVSVTPDSRPAGLYVALPQHRLQLLGPGEGPQHLGLASGTPAVVLQLKKPPQRWTPEDREEYKRSLTQPMEPWLLGTSAGVGLLPTAWQYGPVNQVPADGPKHIAEYTVREGRARVLHLKYAAADASYSEGRGLRPATWAPAASGRGGASGSSGQLGGLRRVEARWLQSVADRARQRPNAQQRGRVRTQREHDDSLAATAPAWLRHRSQDDDGAVLAAEDGGLTEDAELSYRPVWARLQDSGATNPQKVLGWRILHGALLVNAYRVHAIKSLPHTAAYCMALCCEGRQQAETLSHALMECPSIKDAATWLLDLWAVIDGESARPPWDPQVLLADDHRVWAPAPARAALWARLRLAVLQAIWRVRCYRHLHGGDVHSRLAGPAVLQAIEDVRFAIQQDWMRVEKGSSGIVAESGLPTSWFRGRDPTLKQQQFEDKWAYRGVLCSVEPPESPTGQPRLSLKIHAAWATVPVPGAAVVMGS